VFFEHYLVRNIAAIANSAIRLQLAAVTSCLCVDHNLMVTQWTSVTVSWQRCLISLASVCQFLLYLWCTVGRYSSHKRVAMWKLFSGFYTTTTMAFSRGAGKCHQMTVEFFLFTVIIFVCVSVSHIHSHRFFCCLLSCFNIVEVSEMTNSMLGWPLKLTHW